MHSGAALWSGMLKQGSHAVGGASQRQLHPAHRLSPEAALRRWLVMHVRQYVAQAEWRAEWRAA